MFITPYRSIALSLALFSVVTSFAQPTCTPTTTNGTCPTLQALVIGAACVNGTTCGGGLQAASTCLFAGSQCSWYAFTATSVNMFVNITVTATSGCHISSNVYRSTGACFGVEVACQSGAPLDDVHFLTGLTIGALYYVQVCYSPGGPCGNTGSAQYCIQAGVTPPLCNTCSTPCGAAQGFTTTPTIPQVVAGCSTAPFTPPLQPGTTHKFCNSFVATNSTVNFNVIITSNCGTGNVTAFSWELYNSPSCGAPIQTGTLASLTFAGLTVGNTYVFCYSFTVPAGCTHSQHCPYFVGAIALPVTWMGIWAQVIDDRWVDVDWATASETNTDQFIVERSKDAIDFREIGRLPASGGSVVPLSYRLRDPAPLPGIQYYRVVQTDLDGAYSYSNVVVAELHASLNDAILMPNPVSGDASLSFHSDLEGAVTIQVFDAFGRVVMSGTHRTVNGMNNIPLSTSVLPEAVYVLRISSLKAHRSMRFIKDR